MIFPDKFAFQTKDSYKEGKMPQGLYVQYSLKGTH